MKYFRFNGKNDLWLGKYGKLERTLIPNELLTQKEVDKVKKECPKLNIDKVFTVLDLSPNDTYISFGARFQDGTDHNTKFESKKYNKKLSIRESDNVNRIFYIVKENPNNRTYEIVDQESTLSAAKSLAYEYETSDFRHHGGTHYYVATIDDVGNTRGYLPLYSTKQDTPPFNKNWKIV